MQRFRRNLGQRLKYKAPFVHRGMWYGQHYSINDRITEEQYVNVNRARPFFMLALAAYLLFNPKDGRHQYFRRLRSLEGDGAIQEPGLSGDLHGFGFVDRRE